MNKSRSVLCLLSLNQKRILHVASDVYFVRFRVALHRFTISPFPVSFGRYSIK